MAQKHAPVYDDGDAAGPHPDGPGAPTDRDVSPRARSGIKNMIRTLEQSGHIRRLPYATSDGLPQDHGISEFLGHALAICFKDFDAVLDYVNASLLRSAGMLEASNLRMAQTLARMEARERRIDRTQAETGELLHALAVGE